MISLPNSCPLSQSIPKSYQFLLITCNPDVKHPHMQSILILCQLWLRIHHLFPFSGKNSLPTKQSKFYLRFQRNLRQSITLINIETLINRGDQFFNFPLTLYPHCPSTSPVLLIITGSSSSSTSLNLMALPCSAILRLSLSSRTPRFSSLLAST